MRVLGTGTKTAVHNTLDSQHKLTVGQKFNTQKKSPEPVKRVFDDKLNRRQQISSTVRVDRSSNSQPKNVIVKSNSPVIVLNIPVVDNKESKEEDVLVGACKNLEDLMSNLRVTDEKLKTRTQEAVQKKGNDSCEKTNSLSQSFLKLNISDGKNERQEQKVKKQKDEGELIERGPVASSKKLQSSAALPYTRPYTQTSVLPLSARYSWHSGGIVAEQQCISYNSHMPMIPQTVEEISNNSTVSVGTNGQEEVITPEISTDILNEDFLSSLNDWASRVYEQCNDSITTNLSPADIQLPIINEPTLGNTSLSCPRDSVYGNTSPHCSGDSTYGTLSPDSNVISPVSYTSPMSSPIYSENEFTNDTLLNEIVTSESSSDSIVLPNEPVASSDLFNLIEEFNLGIDQRSNEPQQNKQCNDFVEFIKPKIGNQTQQNCQFGLGVSPSNSVAPQHVQIINNSKLTTGLLNINSATSQDLQAVNQEFLSEIPCSNSVSPHVQEVVNSKLSAGMSRTNIVPTPHVNTKLSSINIDQPWNEIYSMNQFDNFAVPNVVTAAPPKHLLTNIPVTDHVVNRQTVCIPARPSKQISHNVPVVNATPQLIYQRNVMLNTVTEISTKKNISKPIVVNSTLRFNTPTSSIRPVERQILPAGPVVYETGIPAAVRLKTLMKNKDFTVQYVKVCHDLANKPELLKERLFQLLSKDPKVQNWLISIYAHIALTLSMQCKAAVLTARNNEGHTLLYLACMNHPDQPVIARYIADSLLDLNFSPDEVYDNNGNSLLHLLASMGESHVFVLAELLNVHHPQTAQPVCNVNRPNDSQMETPLHVAVSKHSLPSVNCLATVKLLIAHGANVAAQNKKEMTPLHYAVQGLCEQKILTLLLQSPSSHAALDIKDFEHNTALHLAAANNSINIMKQKAIMWSLIGHGANYRIQNMDGKVALALVDNERRQEIKKLFVKK